MIRLFLKSPCGKGRVCGRTSSRRDEGVDKYPQPKNNAEIGVRRPERSKYLPRSGMKSKPKNLPLLHGLLRTSLAAARMFDPRNRDGTTMGAKRT